MIDLLKSMLCDSNDIQQLRKTWEKIPSSYIEEYPSLLNVREKLKEEFIQKLKGGNI